MVDLARGDPGFCRALTRHEIGLQAGSMQKILDLAASRIAGARGCTPSATSGRGAPAWMATCATIKGPVSSDAQKISLVRIRSIDCECEGGGMGPKEAIAGHSHGPLPPTRPRQPSPRWGGRPGGRPRCALLQRIRTQRNWTRCLPAAYLNWRRTRDSLLSH